MRPSARAGLLLAMMVLGSLACSGGRLTLTEYADRVESLVLEMNYQIKLLDDELAAESSPSADTWREIYEARVATRTEFSDALRELEPPESVEELHATALEVVGRLAAAELRLADAAVLAEEGDDRESLVREAFLEWQRADADAQALCEAAQEEFDSTRERAALAGTVWIPPEMKEIVRVALVCDAADL